ncbi:MAG: ABC transporter permease [Pseudomonadota bacterium]
MFWPKAAILDIIETFKDLPLVGMLGWQDVRHRYKRSSVGPFWLTASMGIMIATMGMIFGKIFHTPLKEFLPFLAVGIILWGFISTATTEACASFALSAPLIKQHSLPLFLYVARVLWRNMLVLVHNIAIFPIVLLCVGKMPSWEMVLCIPGFLLFLLNFAWLSLMLGILCARYRDLIQLINSLMQIIFYATPIMWMPDKLSQGSLGAYLVNFNPLYHLISLVRTPLLGGLPTATNWEVSLILALFGWTASLLVYARCRNRIAYWL